MAGSRNEKRPMTLTCHRINIAFLKVLEMKFVDVRLARSIGLSLYEEVT